MTLELKIILILVALVILLFLLWRRASMRLSDVRFQKQSLSTKYGKMSEQFMPFLDHYPYDPQYFRFLGTPIDGVQFEEDKIIFMEFKCSNSRLSQKQKNIKDLIEARRIYFEQINIK